jgi:hypothetical protein
MDSLELVQHFFSWWSAPDAAEFRFAFILVNALLGIINIVIIIGMIVSIRRFRGRVAIQDKSRIAYLEEFKGYIQQVFIKMDNIKDQLNRIEDRQRGRKCGLD